MDTKIVRIRHKARKGSRSPFRDDELERAQETIKTIQMISLLREEKLKVIGTKQELIDRLRDYYLSNLKDVIRFFLPTLWQSNQNELASQLELTISKKQ